MTQPWCHDPRGGTWWEVEDVVACKKVKGKTRYLVLYKGFSEAYDEWKAERDVSKVLVQSYRELLERAAAAAS